jgi:SSS family solute:Na+ symporter
MEQTNIVTRFLQSSDYVLLLSYFAIVVFIGNYFKKYIRQAKDYFAAGSAVPWWLSAISLWLSSFSATFFVIYSQIAFKYGIVAMSIAWTVVIAMIPATFFFSKRWRRARVITPLGFMEQRYNKVAHQVFVWTGFPLRLIDNSLRILATSIFLVPAIGGHWFNLSVSILIVGTIMVLFSVLGGQWAVLVVDFFQFMILGLAVVIFFIIALSAVGGFTGLISTIHASPDIPRTFFHPIAPPYDIFYWIMFACVTFLSYNASWGLVQKYNCVATEKDAQKVALGMGILSFLGPLIFFFPAIAARAYLPAIMGASVMQRSDEVYVLMALKILPVGLMGMLVAGMCSATLSTLGNEYNVLSGILTKDFYGKIIRPDADERRLVLWGRYNTVFIGALTTMLALGLQYLRQVFNLIDILVKILGSFGPAIMLPYLAGLVLKKVNARGAITGVIAGTISGVSLIILNGVLLSVYRADLATNPTLSYWLKQGYNTASIAINILATILGLWIGSRLSKTPEDERRHAEEFIRRMAVVSEPKIETGRKVESPFSLVGLSLLVYAAIFFAVIIIMAIKGKPEQLGVNLAAAGLTLVSGLLFRWFSKRKKKSAEA